MTDSITSFDLVIVGGGTDGSGVAASIIKRNKHLNIAIIEPSDKHYYQPAWILVGAGEFDAAKSKRNMADCMPSS